MESRAQNYAGRNSLYADGVTFSNWPQLKAVRNALRTGHCAPTVMRTLRELQGVDSKPMVKLVSAMGGGVGLLRNECGAVSSSVLFLGLIYGQEAGDDGIPKVITLGQKFLERFRDGLGGGRCREVTPTFKNVFPCMQAMCRAPRYLVDVVNEDKNQILTGINLDTRHAYGDLLQFFCEQKFHCAHSVLLELQDDIDINEEHLRATWGLLGGTVLQGMTCGALAAGVLAIGIKYGGFENSYLRVSRLLFSLAAGQEFMYEHYSAFSKSMNIANRLGLWFNEEFGATECKDILGKDLSVQEGIAGYLTENTVERCRGICSRVTPKVRELLREFL